MRSRIASEGVRLSFGEEEMLLRVKMDLCWLCKSPEREILVTFLLARGRQSRAGLVPMCQGPGAAL